MLQTTVMTRATSVIQPGPGLASPEPLKGGESMTTRKKATRKKATRKKATRKKATRKKAARKKNCRKHALHVGSFLPEGLGLWPWVD